MKSRHEVRSVGRLLDLLRTIHLRGRLLPMLTEAFAENTCLCAARDVGLAVSDSELQRAANDFRHRRGLTSADQTREWLVRQQLSVLDLEETMERELLIEKFKDHLAAQGAAARFDTLRDRYARVRLRELVVASEGLARELLHRLHEEGADFADLARQHSLAPSREQGGDSGVLLRAELPAPVAEAIFATSPGDTVGPILASGGYHLYHVEQFLPTERDARTQAFIRQELFDAWLRERLAEVKLDLDWLKGHDGPG